MLLVMLAVLCGSLLAQLPTATVLGTVNDDSGAVVPGANVTIRNTETGQSRSATSSADGSYRFNALPVGNYEARVTQQGFETSVVTGITLTVSQEATINFALKVGQIEQQVTVSGGAQTKSEALGHQEFVLTYKASGSNGPSCLPRVA